MVIPAASESVNGLEHSRGAAGCVITHAAAALQSLELGSYGRQLWVCHCADLIHAVL